ncbi:hypothetical protein CIG75_01805 [Tumebacillus algifaecis]|uniref:Uncharacterized protein n=1 Tax=Tumebacillus algifaecis TaxID=1214604 RepID=A0A223CWX5_9BACL|nr:DUF1385 domain-containing protein [Tumebacillus algifaecis]ASS73830.1 hypothetical protein CIG75_01805 [Tumebacillus algifaecis]
MTVSLFVMWISIVLLHLSGAGLGQREQICRCLLLLLQVAGLSFELILFAGGTTNKCVPWRFVPGMLLYKYTTRAPHARQDRSGDRCGAMRDLWVRLQ